HRRRGPVGDAACGNGYHRTDLRPARHRIRTRPSSGQPRPYRRPVHRHCPRPAGTHHQPHRRLARARRSPTSQDARMIVILTAAHSLRDLGDVEAPGPTVPAHATDTGPGRSKLRLNASMAIGGGLVVLIVGLALVSFLWTPYDPSDIDPIA